MPIIYEHENSRSQLVKTSEHEAIDMHTGEKYKLERVDNQTSTGWGIVVGLILGFLMWAVFYSSSAPPPPNSPMPVQPPINGETRS